MKQIIIGLCGSWYLFSGKSLPGYLFILNFVTVMLYASETCCCHQNQIDFLQRPERAMMRDMCSMKFVDRMKTKDLMQMLW